MSTAIQSELALRALGHELSQEKEAFGFLSDSSHLIHDFAALRQRMEEDGYLFLRGFFPRAAVLEARKFVTDRLMDGGFLDPAYPSLEAVLARPGLKIVNSRSAFRPPGGAEK